MVGTSNGRRLLFSIAGAFYRIAKRLLWKRRCRAAHGTVQGSHYIVISQHFVAIERFFEVP